MKNYANFAWFLLCSIIVVGLVGCNPPDPNTPSSGRPQREPTEDNHVQQQIVPKYAVVFGVRPDEQGKLIECKPVSVRELATKKDVTFTPSESFTKEACELFSTRQWKVRRDEGGQIKEVYDFCFYSEQIPDKAICKSK